jgi:O-methyltransferase involved in polyketide biosynthesis
LETGAFRAAAAELVRLIPDALRACQQNRQFLARAVRFLVGEVGIRQFIDIGTGLPPQGSVHEVAQASTPDARVIYVDYDPMVLSHARALLAGPNVAVVAADLRDPAAVLADPELRAVIDPAEPVCVVLAAVLHFLDAATAREVTAGYTRLIAPGSCLVLSCATYDDEALAKRLAAE